MARETSNRGYLPHDLSAAPSFRRPSVFLNPSGFKSRWTKRSVHLTGMVLHPVLYVAKGQGDYLCNVQAESTSSSWFTGGYLRLLLQLASGFAPLALLYGS